MLFHPIFEAPTALPCHTLPTPEIWRRSTRPAGWTGCPAPEELFGEWLDRICEEEEVVLSPALDAAYDRAIDAAFAKVMALVCGTDRQGF